MNAMIIAPSDLKLPRAEDLEVFGCGARRRVWVLKGTILIERVIDHPTIYGNCGSNCAYISCDGTIEILSSQEHGAFVTKAEIVTDIFGRHPRAVVTIGTSGTISLRDWLLNPYDVNNEEPSNDWDFKVSLGHILDGNFLPIPFKDIRGEWNGKIWAGTINGKESTLKRLNNYPVLNIGGKTIVAESTYGRIWTID